MYLKKLGLENFRKFKDYQEFEFKPITILVGPNNSGKSSLIKALLLLQENLINGLDDLKFGSETKHRILSFGHALNSSSKKPYFRIKCEFDAAGKDIHAIEQDVWQDKGATTIDVTFEQGLKNDNTAIRSIELFDQDGKLVISGRQSLSSLFKDSRARVYVLEAIQSFLDYAPPYRSIGLQRYSKKKFINFSKQLKGLKPILDTGQQEENSFITKWCGSDPGYNIGDVRLLENDDFYEIQLMRDNQLMDLSHLGTGASQILSIIIQIVTHDQQMVILEEPETNLHPKYQSKLADMLVDGINEPLGNRFIIETHSEYLIRKLQYLVAKDSRKDIKHRKVKSEDIQIYYFSDIKNKAPELLTIENDGSLSGDFGKGFFDEAPYLITELWKAQRN